MPVKTKNSKTKMIRHSTNDSKMMSFGGAIASFFKKYFQFSGVATRAEFLWNVLFYVLGFVGCFGLGCGVAYIIVHTGHFVDPLDMFGVVLITICLPVLLFYLVMLTPAYALMSRRLHDTGISAKLLWMVAVPQLIHIIAFVLLFCGVIIHNPVFNTILWCLQVILYVAFIVCFVLCLFPSKTTGNLYRK